LAFSAEVISLNRADHSFDTHIRVGIPAQIVEAPDAALIGKASLYIQSLSYTASKVIPLNLQFSNALEVSSFMHDELCNEVHEVTLKPIRESGTKGSNSFVVKMKAKIVTVHGLIIAEKNKPFSQYLVCKKEN
jgi:hypothetical protein